jgi:predicted DNA binding protein
VSFESRRELLVWADAPDFEAFSRALAADPTVDDLDRAIEVDDRYLCRISLSESGAGVDFYPILTETGSVVHSATVTAEGWDCHFGFADAPALSRFFDAVDDHGIGYDIYRVYEPRDSARVDDGMTDAQREALATAMDIGYFDVPRDATLQDLSAELDISDSAASERIRRGVQTLVETTLLGRSRTSRG